MGGYGEQIAPRRLWWRARNEFRFLELPSLGLARSTAAQIAQIVVIQCRVHENARILVLGYLRGIALCSTKIQFFRHFRIIFEQNCG